MKMFISLKSKTVLVLLLAVLFLVVSGFLFVSAKGETANAKTLNDRALFIKRLGIDVVKSAESRKEVQIPLHFSDVYKRYNNLQKTAGYDLSLYKGETAVLYSYPAKDAPEFRVNLLCYKDRVIGGDMSSVKLSGKMVALKSEEMKKCLN